MSYMVGWIRGAPNQDGTPLCERCHHHADAHLKANSCSVRGRWLRRCRCSGYTRAES
ncbi:MAG: hypothetical protein ACLP3Q_18335 [Streptosporangiaceae bacterium]